MNEEGEAVFARLSITDPRGKFYAPERAWIAADDGFDRRERNFEAHYFDLTANLGPNEARIPANNPDPKVRFGVNTFRVTPSEISVPVGDDKNRSNEGFCV